MAQDNSSAPAHGYAQDGTPVYGYRADGTPITVPLDTVIGTDPNGAPILAGQEASPSSRPAMPNIGTPAYDAYAAAQRDEEYKNKLVAQGGTRNADGSVTMKPVDMVNTNSPGMDAAEMVATGGATTLLNETGAGDSIMDPIEEGVTKGSTYAGNLFGIGGDGGSVGQTALAQSEVANPKMQANTTYAKALEEAARASNYRGPGEISPERILLPDQLSRSNYWNYTPTASESVDATGRMRKASTVDVAQVPLASVSGINTTIPAPKLSEAEQTGAVTVGKVQADPLADALRAEQIRNAQNISAAPSAVQPTMQAGQVEALQNALAVASQARGAERAGARREAILASQQGGLAASLKAAALGAQEEQQKRVATTEALSGIRSQDVTTSLARQQIEAQRVTLQAQLDAAIAQGNTAAVNEIKKQQAALDIQARTSEVQAGIAQQNTVADLAKANLGVQATSALANQAATNTSAADYAKATNAAAEAAAARQTATNLANTQAAQAQAEANMNRAATIEQQNVANTQAARTQNAANALDAAKTTAQLGVESERTRQGGTTAALNTSNVSAGTGVSAANTVVDANKSQSAANAQSDAATKAMIAAGLTAAAASDARVKADISPVGTGTATYDEMEEGTRRMHPQQMADTRTAFDAIDRGDMAPTPNSRDWAQFFGRNARADFDSMNAAYLLKKAAMRGDTGEQLSDERTKREVDAMDDQEIQDWGDKATKLPVTYRYKPGVGDDGKEVQLGVLAQDLEKTGPLGKINVHQDADGIRSVAYGPAAFMLAKAGFDRATEARDLARALASAAEGMPSEREDVSEFGPALALAASRAERRKDGR